MKLFKTLFPELISNTHHLLRFTFYVLRFTFYHLRFTSYVLLALLLAVVPATLLPLPVAAQSPDAEVDFYIKSPEADTPLTVGDQITLRLEITHPSDSGVALPQLEEQWQSFTVIDQDAPETVDNLDGTLTTGKDIVVALFRPGQFQTPKLVITHRKPDESIEELAAPVIPINITSILTEDTELRDIKAQAELPLPPIWPWVVGGLLLTMLLAGLLTGAGLWFYHRWKQRTAPSLVLAPVVDPRPPQVIAQVELDRIEALNLPAQNQVKEHYILVSDCLRYYIEGIYQIPALEQTSGELRQAFRKSSVPVRDMAGFMSILSESDLVKFARYMPKPDDSYGLVDKARAVVEATVSLPEAVEAPPSEAEVIT